MKRMIRQSKQQFQGQGPQHQKGMTAIAMALILVMIAFFAMIVLRLFPIYMEHFNVASHLKNLSTESGVAAKTNKEIISTLTKRFQIDDVKNVNDEHIFIDREKNGHVTVAVEYEVRTPALANVEMVVHFEDEVELK